MSAAVPTAGTLITLAPTGAESAKVDVPALPVTVEEVVAAARDCQAVGAAVVHLHVRGTDTRPTLDLARVREVVAAVRESTDLVVQLSSGGAVTDPLPDRVAVLDAEPGLVGGVVERWPDRPVTRFERKGVEAGRAPVDLAYQARPVP